jgi:hypothetical protein
MFWVGSNPNQDLYHVLQTMCVQPVKGAVAVVFVYIPGPAWWAVPCTCHARRVFFIFSLISLIISFNIGFSYRKRMLVYSLSYKRCSDSVPIKGCKCNESEISPADPADQ